MEMTKLRELTEAEALLHRIMEARRSGDLSIGMPGESTPQHRPGGAAMSHAPPEVTMAYVGYHDGEPVMVFVDDGSVEMHQTLADHLRLPGRTAQRKPIDEARKEICDSIERRARRGRAE
jgi:hypothetical protein